MGLKDCEYLAPSNLSEALDLKARLGADAVWLAGGTDLMPRARNKLVSPKAVISLKNLVQELSGVEDDGAELKIGALTSLEEAGAHQAVRDRLPGLVQALKSIGAPTLQQRVGTMGGNLCADTRCLYYNQSAFWRSGVAPCFKLGGEVCHPGGATADRCRSICQADGAIMLAALDARVSLAAGSGERELGLEEFFTGRGEEPLAMGPDELLINVKVPTPKGQGSAYCKLAARKAIDYPLISAAAAVSIDADGVVAKASLALGGVFAAPLMLKDATQAMKGQKCGPKELEKVARKAGSHAQPFFIENQSAPAEWRAEMAPVVAKRALSEALAGAKGQI
jgi:4-hydroxybenzoyl-CoA reductase subunit beta